MLLLQRQINRSALCCHYLLQTAKYSTVPKVAAGSFTSNKLINSSRNDDFNNVQRTLVYIGPLSETLKRYKLTASFFGICGCIAVPALLFSGHAPPLSIALAGVSAVAPSLFVHFYTKGYVTKLIVYDDIKNVEKERKQPKTIKDKFISLETISFLGRSKQETMWLSQLAYVSSVKALIWKQKVGARHTFTLERPVMEADAYLRALVKRVQSREVA
ncbi:hypothetical protein BDF20DRAFT_851140 [Mycotypha africana]|uniref:uncharacterized protein n=1 Tax=Mycotypha africana TaxID=64632 RepID=UPI0023016E55|nr:uncharacterized protein BDF20DRAFT_851140 [Mycotypha africana]KAI8987607.1 hypothetical protein BDF20DRAFT_851140 [Mycotypha africana]